MSEETVEDLMVSYNRVALDEIADAIGLDSAQYPNKRSIAEAILTAKAEQRETERMVNEREADMQELKKKMVENTVRGKIAAIKVTAEKMQKSVKSLKSEFPKQMKENEQAIAEFNTSVQEQTNENQEAVVTMQTGIKGQMNENREAVAGIQSSVEEQISEKQAYVKNFYG